MTETQDKITPSKTPVKSGFNTESTGGKSAQDGSVRLSDLAAKRAQNLRDNLARRKQQTRARAESDTDSE